MPHLPTIDEVRLLPDPDQHKVLVATLERVNRASNAARVVALQRNLTGPTDEPALREVVREAIEQAKLPDAFVRATADRVAAAFSRRGGKQAKFSSYQSLTYPAGACKWPGSDRVTLPTAAGRRTIAVRVDPARGDLRPPLEGRPVSLVYRNGEFHLVAADVERPRDDDY